MNLHELTKHELYRLATAADINRRSIMRKDQLIEAIAALETNDPVMFGALELNHHLHTTDDTPAPAAPVAPAEPATPAIPVTVPEGRISEVIGTVEFAEASEPITEHHTYYAADYRTYTVLPGVYDVHLTRENATSQAYVTITVDIEVTRSVLHSGFGGVNFATDEDETVRKETKTYRPYAYEAARAAADFRPKLVRGAFHLADGWAVLTRHERFDNGDHYTSNKFVKLPD